MDLSVIYEQLESIKQESSRNRKEELLRAYDSDEFRSMLYYLGNDFIVTGLAKSKIQKQLDGEPEVKLSQLGEVLSYLGECNTGRDEDVLVAQYYINSQDAQYREFLEEVLTKTYRMGVTAKTINKVYKGLVPVFDVQLAYPYDKYKDKVSGSYTVSTKLDGHRLIAIKEGGDVRFYSRTGQVIYGLDELAQAIEDLGIDNYVFDGEAEAIGVSKADTYKETTKLLRKDGSKQGVRMTVFDGLPLDEFRKGRSKLAYSDRRKQLTQVIEDGQYIRLIDCLYQGEDYGQIPNLLNEAISKGEEGIMVNIDSELYYTKRHKGVLKVKAMMSDDLLCVGVFEGDGKYRGKLGGIQVDYKGSIVGVGSGFSDADRELYYSNPDLIIGKIVEIQYFETTTNQKSEGESLRFPVFKGLRLDKSEPSIES